MKNKKLQSMMMSDEFVNERKSMVNHQMARRDIYDKNVLKIFEEIPRHEFVPKEFIDQSYEDHPVLIGKGQTISQPYMVALMTQELEPKKEDVVLEIGAGSGYQAAVLSKLVKKVYSVERHEALAENAKEILKKLNISNVEVIVGDGTKGLKEKAPFDKIIVTAHAKSFPERLFSQLKEGGIMVIPIGNFLGQMLYQITKKNGQPVKREVCGCVFVPLVEG